MISESIPEFKLLDICDKAYIYIAYYFYSVRSSISLKSEKFDSVEVPLTILLDSIESNYKKESINYKFYNWNSIIHYPTQLIFDDPSTIAIDMLSSLRKIESLEIKQEHLEDIRKSTPTKILSELDYAVIKNFSLPLQSELDVLRTEIY